MQSTMYCDKHTATRAIATKKDIGRRCSPVGLSTQYTQCDQSEKSPDTTKFPDNSLTIRGTPGHCNWLKVKRWRYSSLWEDHQRSTERHLPYGITRFYLPPDTGERNTAR